MSASVVRPLDRRLARARDFIHERYLESPSLAAMAEAACMSPAHFVRQFKRTFGITPARYVTRLKLDASRRMLETSDLDVTDVLFNCGFGNRSAFSRLFKTHYGVPPRVWRQVTVGGSAAAG